MANARRLIRGGVLVSLFLLGFSLCLAAYSYVRIVRLSYVEGEVYVERPGTESERGIANLPLVHDAVVETAEGVAEIEFESDAFARLAANSWLHLTELALRDTGGRVTTLTLERGTATFYADPRRDDSFLVLTPYFQASIPKRAEFRVDLTSNGGRVLVFDGEVSLDTRAGAMNLGKGRMFEWDQTSQEFLVARNPERDSWDQWNAERDHQVDASRHEAIPVHLSYGAYDLQRYGQWSSLVGFGPVWQPYVAIGWSPFVSGRWVWYPHFGWSWVSYEPWGWLPYHYGNWHYDPFWGWVWVPGFFDVWSHARTLWVYQSGWVG
ncbi:MAG: FecR family protein, partial [Chloroflexota bacterium]